MIPLKLIFPLKVIFEKHAISFVNSIGYQIRIIKYYIIIIKYNFI